MQAIEEEERARKQAMEDMLIEREREIDAKKDNDQPNSPLKPEPRPSLKAKEEEDKAKAEEDVFGSFFGGRQAEEHCAAKEIPPSPDGS